MEEVLIQAQKKMEIYGENIMHQKAILQQQ